MSLSLSVSLSLSLTSLSGSLDYDPPATTAQSSFENGQVATYVG
jgi:hypothetical protein